jgi:hypothetical protein
MRRGMRSGGFFAGAIGGLALALLLVGVASFLPQSNSALRAVSAPTKDVGAGASAAATTTNAVASTTTACPAAQASCSLSVASSVTQAAAPNPAVSSHLSVAAGGAATTTTVTATTTTTTASSNALTASNPPSVQGAGSPYSCGQQQQRPSSLLAVLPGESVGSLIATISPLLVGLLVAVLIYGAYTRRQDSSS